MINHYNDILKSPGSYVFIAIDFSDKFDHIYRDIIYPSVVDAGMLPIRSDEVSSESENIHLQIRQLIQNSRFFIADITYTRPLSFANVLLELGIAIAFDRPLVIMTQDDERPSDTSHLRTMKYSLSNTGKEKAKQELISILQKSTNPAEAVLQKMLVCSDSTNYIVFGHATQEHIDSVFPPVNDDYHQRLRTISSEASGISQLTIAFQKIAWSMGKDKIGIISVNGYGAPCNIFTYGNVFVFGGPGANPLFDKAINLASCIYVNTLNIKFEQIENEKKRYYISRNDQKYPDYQYDLYNKKKDVGFVMRFPNPENKSATITIAAGIRAYGTEGAIKLLVTPSLISKLNVYSELNENTGFWAIVEVAYSDESKHLENITIIESEVLVKHTHLAIST